ncbi:hypothetical protein SteCoe_17304 [Stentor coeruleus]|uniref:Uncharacterized protein n=1 Tax=Stentor coeruleus TaxID=5963 RepID=A0A1R2BZ92_9CILI|nr:hypothetical protein SteCoe_17304 [Stentor coeruleus]
MGGDSSKANSFGEVAITYDSNSVYSGSTVSGNINISIKKHLKKAHVTLCFKGSENTSWIERVSVHGHDASKSKQKNQNEEFKGKHSICNTVYELHRWENGLVKGHYVLPFTYQLPSGIPGTFLYQQDKTKAQIRYKFKVEIFDENDQKIYDKQPIHVMQEALTYATDLSQSKKTKVTCCWCCSRGNCILEIYNQQDTYNPEQVANVVVKVNTTDSKSVVKNISCKLYYSMRLKSSNDMSHFTTLTLLQTSSTVNVKNNGFISDCQATLNLNLPTIKKKLEMMYTTRGTLIDFCYSIEVRASIKGCFFCLSERPSLIQSINIVPNAIILPSAPSAPEDWQPTYYDMVRLSL